MVKVTQAECELAKRLVKDLSGRDRPVKTDELAHILAAHRIATIEECAKSAEEWAMEGGCSETRRYADCLADTIRALKGGE